MKKSILSLAIFLPFSAQAIEGYPPQYLDRNQTLYVHNIVCGDFKNQRSLKPAAIYAPTPTLQTGQYFVNSAYGKFSYLFKPIEGQPEQVMMRGLMLDGQTDESKAKVDACIVGSIDGLPKNITKHLKVVELKPDDKNWDKTMEQFALVAGRPAFGEGVYEDPRKTAANDAHDQQVFKANQAVIKHLEQQFSLGLEKYAKQLPSEMKKAVKYANQEDGFIESKKYPIIKEPAVWTAVAERRYKDQVQRLNTEKQWDLVIQETFDWFFKQIEKGAQLTSASTTTVATPVWSDGALTQTVSLSAEFDNGKTLVLDFPVQSSKVDMALFDALDDIKKKSEAERKSMVVRKKKIRKILKPEDIKDFKVYKPSEKTHLFFSPYRNRAAGDTWRIQ